VPVVPNVSLHHAVDADTRGDGAANRQQSATSQNDVRAPVSQPSFLVVNEQSEQACRNAFPTMQNNQNEISNRRKPLESVERIDWKTHAERIMAFTVQRKPTSLTQRKRNHGTFMWAGIINNDCNELN
jgi:hypothetical protein